MKKRNLSLLLLAIAISIGYSSTNINLTFKAKHPRMGLLYSVTQGAFIKQSHWLSPRNPKHTFVVTSNEHYCVIGGVLAKRSPVCFLAHPGVDVNIDIVQTGLAHLSTKTVWTNQPIKLTVPAFSDGQSLNNWLGNIANEVQQLPGYKTGVPINLSISLQPDKSGNFPINIPILLPPNDIISDNSALDSITINGNNSNITTSDDAMEVDGRGYYTTINNMTLTSSQQSSSSSVVHISNNAYLTADNITINSFIPMVSLQGGSTAYIHNSNLEFGTYSELPVTVFNVTGGSKLILDSDVTTLQGNVTAAKVDNSRLNVSGGDFAIQNNLDNNPYAFNINNDGTAYFLPEHFTTSYGSTVVVPFVSVTKSSVMIANSPEFDTKANFTNKVDSDSALFINGKRITK
ncbi:hypothetical protein [Cysteiniphilum halobium]|uniref:hypothetical protein n=1 Tax=Cysteiniphilum halobium TaxID=2219059 RepID=UPI003F84078E